MAPVKGLVDERSALYAASDAARSVETPVVADRPNEDPEVDANRSDCSLPPPTS